MVHQLDHKNVDIATIEGFGAEWEAFDQSGLRDAEYEALFQSYFGIFPFDVLAADAEGFDLGCGSGRWAERVAQRVGLLHCIDPSSQALGVAKRRLRDLENVEFHCAAADAMPLADRSQDFGYCLGVLHHAPDTREGLCRAVEKLRPGAPFLLYLYYALDDRPVWFKAIWRASDLARKAISLLPFGVRRRLTDLIAAGVYWPLARSAALADAVGVHLRNWPLAYYRHASFYTMRTDALDRLGTRLEQRFTKADIETMMREAGLIDIRFSDAPPYWCACGIRS